MLSFSFFFFFNAPATTEIYTLSLHDALPIFDVNEIECLIVRRIAVEMKQRQRRLGRHDASIGPHQDRKSTRLNSSHRCISYAVFCLKKKKKKNNKKFTKRHNILTCKLRCSAS